MDIGNSKNYLGMWLFLLFRMYRILADTDRMIDTRATGVTNKLMVACLDWLYCGAWLSSCPDCEKPVAIVLWCILPIHSLHTTDITVIAHTIASLLCVCHSSAWVVRVPAWDGIPPRNTNLKHTRNAQPNTQTAITAIIHMFDQCVYYFWRSPRVLLVRTDVVRGCWLSVTHGRCCRWWCLLRNWFRSHGSNKRLASVFFISLCTRMSFLSAAGTSRSCSCMHRLSKRAQSVINHSVY